MTSGRGSSESRDTYPIEMDHRVYEECGSHGFRFILGLGGGRKEGHKEGHKGVRDTGVVRLRVSYPRKTTEVPYNRFSYGTIPFMGFFEIGE